MIRKQVYLTPEQDALLEHLAGQGGQTEAKVLRKALDDFVARKDPVKAKLWAQGLLAELPRPSTSPLEAKQLYADYLKWAGKSAFGLSDAVIVEREEAR